MIWANKLEVPRWSQDKANCRSFSQAIALVSKESWSVNVDIDFNGINDESVFWVENFNQKINIVKLKLMHTLKA